MAEGDQQRQYSSHCEMAGQAQSVIVIESSIKPLTYLYLYLFWMLIEHSVIVRNSILIRYLTLKITIRTFSKKLLLIFWCICACVSEIRVFQSSVLGQFLYFMPLALYAQPSLCLFVNSSICFLAFASLHIMSSDLYLPAFNSLQIACFRSSHFTLLNFNIEIRKRITSCIRIKTL